MPSEKVSLLENFVQGDIRPDITFLFDAPIEVGMSRAQKRGALDRFEEEEMSFFNRVRDNYLKRATQEPHRFKVIDASQSLDAVQADLKAVLIEKLNLLAQ